MCCTRFHDDNNNRNRDQHTKHVLIFQVEEYCYGWGGGGERRGAIEAMLFSAREVAITSRKLAKVTLSYVLGIHHCARINSCTSYILRLFYKSVYCLLAVSKTGLGHRRRKVGPGAIITALIIVVHSRPSCPIASRICCLVSGALVPLLKTHSAEYQNRLVVVFLRIRYLLFEK